MAKKQSTTRSQSSRPSEELTKRYVGSQRYETHDFGHVNLQFWCLMASWVLTCKQCSEVFTHFQVSDNTSVNFSIPEIPKFPPTGLERECPKCHAKHIYEQRELIYRAR